MIANMGKNKVETIGRQVCLERHELYEKQYGFYLRPKVVHLETYVIFARPDFK